MSLLLAVGRVVGAPSQVPCQVGELIFIHINQYIEKQAGSLRLKLETWY
ncbi:MAG: hypothetical protein HGA75_09725 [Thiobacillus sp.]|nr:hypothetical protein [Thiobacillus sp.]